MVARETASTDWVLRAAQACEATEIARDQGEAALIREVHDLLCNAPAPITAELGLPCPKVRIEQLLELDARREAAFHLLGRAVYLISRSAGGRITATVVAGETIPEVSGVGPSEAIAVCGALSEGLRDWAERNAVTEARLRRAH